MNTTATYKEQQTGNTSNFLTDLGDMIGFGAARRQREFLREMSNTAVQRQVEDMNEAGINPAMAYSGSASGASTPSGATAAVGSGVGQLSQLINSVANVMNANTSQIRTDRYNNHLDYKEQQKLDTTTTQIYNSAGKLVRQVLFNKISGA